MYLERIMEYAWLVPLEEEALKKYRVASDSLLHGSRVHHCRLFLKIPMRGKLLLFRVANPPLNTKAAAWHLLRYS